jgi:indolepyruvate ferredoxin oxidoreductase beta subunit
MTQEFNIVLAGVGGQGILLMGEILGNAAVKEGYNVRVSEIHGMAQRGGAVECHIRIGEKIFAPTVSEGKAHLIIGLEPLETLRQVKYASDNTIIILNTRKLPPQGLPKSENLNYPSLEMIIGRIRLFTMRTLAIDAQNVARKAGSQITENMVMLGAAAATPLFPLKIESLKECIKEKVSTKFLDVNLKAFELGYEMIKKSNNLSNIIIP